MTTITENHSAAASEPTPTVAGPMTLAIDIGGTGLKSSVLDADGNMATPRVRVATPHPSPPGIVLEKLVKLVGPLPPFDRVSVGLAGVVLKGKIITAPKLVQED